MKTTTDKLFKLIKAMTPAEKRYFKRHYGSDSNKLTHLFNAINTQKSYDEEAIKELFKTKMASNLKVYKFQLEQLVIKSLASHRDQSSTAFKLRSGFAAFEILFDKNLLEMAAKQLDRIQQVCRQENALQYQELLFFAEWQNRQALSQGQSFALKTVPEWSSELQGDQANFLKNLNQLNLLIDQIQSSKSVQQDSYVPIDLEPSLLKQPQNYILQRFFSGFQNFKSGKTEEAKVQLEEVLIYLEGQSEHHRQWGSYYLFALRLMAKSAREHKASSMLQKQTQRAFDFSKSEEAFGVQMAYFWAIALQEKIATGQAPKDDFEGNWQYLCALGEEDSFPASWYAAWVAHYGLILGKPELTFEWSKRLMLSESIIFRETGLLLQAIAQILLNKQSLDLQKLFKGLKKTGPFYQSLRDILLEFSGKSTPLNGQLSHWKKGLSNFQQDPTFQLFEKLQLFPIVHTLLSGEYPGKDFRDLEEPGLVKNK